MELPSRHTNTLAATIQGEDADSDEIIMAVDRRGWKMGCAYYTAAESKLCFFDDVEQSTELSTTDYFDACEFLPPDVAQSNGDR